jgi:YggT family protein
VRFLDAVTRPVLAPFQRFIPSLGGVDISPIVAILVIQAARQYLLPWLFAPLFRIVG